MKKSPSDNQISETILDYLYGELSPEEAEAVRHRIDSDPEWKEEHRLLAGTVRALDSWSDQPAPEEALQVVRERVAHTDRNPTVGRAWINVIWERFGPIAAAVLVSVTILWVSTSSLAGADASVKDLLFCGVLWGGIYHMVFTVVMKREASYVWVPAANRGFICLELRRAVLWAIVAFALFFAVALATPNPAPFETRALYASLADRIPAFFAWILPAAYALVGCLIAGFALGRRATGGDSAAQGTLMGVIAGILIVLDLYTYHLVEASSTLLHLGIWSLSAFAVAVACGHWGALLGSRAAPQTTS